MSKNNVIAEIQELVQQIETNYQEGIDYKFVAKSYLEKLGLRNVRILSPRLKNSVGKDLIFRWELMTI